MANCQPHERNPQPSPPSARPPLASPSHVRSRGMAGAGATQRTLQFAHCLSWPLAGVAPHMAHGIRALRPRRPHPLSARRPATNCTGVRGRAAAVQGRSGRNRMGAAGSIAATAPSDGVARHCREEFERLRPKERDYLVLTGGRAQSRVLGSVRRALVAAGSARSDGRCGRRRVLLETTPALHLTRIRPLSRNAATAVASGLSHRHQSLKHHLCPRQRPQWARHASGAPICTPSGLRASLDSPSRA